MHHEILSTAARRQQNRHGAEEAIRYIFGEKDSSGTPRPHPPRLIAGDAWFFQKAASLSNSAPHYFSSSLAFEEAPDQDTPRLVSYIGKIFGYHYVPGVPDDEFGYLDGLHRKDDSFDLHKVLGLRHLRSGKKFEPVRPHVDYWRFKLLTSLVNREFGLSDPLDPKRAVLIKVREREYKKEIPTALEAMEVEIRTRIPTGRINSREGIVTLLKDQNMAPIRETRSIVVEVEGNKWHLDGFCATQWFRSPGDLLRYQKTLSKPFDLVRSDPQDCRLRVLHAFQNRAAEMAKTYQIRPQVSERDLIIPSREYFADYSSPINTQHDSPIFRDRPIQIHYEGSQRDPAHSQERTRFDVAESLGGAKGSDPQRSAARDARNRTPQKPGTESPNAGKTGSIHSANHESGDGNPFGHSLIASHTRTVKDGSRETREYCECVGEWSDLIFKLLGVPRLIRLARKLRQLATPSKRRSKHSPSPLPQDHVPLPSLDPRARKFPSLHVARRAPAVELSDPHAAIDKSPNPEI